jgi:hypothetical protein
MEKLRKHISHGTEGVSSESNTSKDQDRGRFHRQCPVSAVSRILASVRTPNRSSRNLTALTDTKSRLKSLEPISQAKAQRQSPDSPAVGTGSKRWQVGRQRADRTQGGVFQAPGRLQGRVPHWTVRNLPFQACKIRRSDGDRLTASYLTPPLSAPFLDPASTDICCVTGNDDRSHARQG